MFENQLDSSVFLSSLSSVSNRLTAVDNENYFQDLSNAVNIVSMSVNKILLSNLSSLEKKESTVKVRHISSRLHEILLFGVLRSNNFSSSEATTYYQSISHRIPNIKWQFYVLLIFKCQWTNYFFECVQQLPLTALRHVLDEFFKMSSENKLRWYSMHLVVELIFKKLYFMAEKSEPNVECSFSFDFSYSGAKSGTIEAKEFKEILKLELFPKIYENVSNTSQKDDQFDLEEIHFYLHAFKTLFKFLKDIEIENYDEVKAFVPFCQIVLQNLVSDSCQELLKSVMVKQVNPSALQTHAYATASWGICEMYLTFLVCYFWADFEQKSTSNELCEKQNSCITSDFLSEIKNHNFYSILRSFNPLLNGSPLSEQEVSFLKNALEHSYTCADRAGEILLSNCCVLNADILSVLNKNVPKLNVVRAYPLMIDAIMKPNCSEIKSEALKLFHEALSKAPLENYNEILHFILANYGYCENLKLPDFDSQVKQIQCKALSLEEVKVILPSLLIQSPRLVLNYVIEEILLQGFEGESLIQGLKYVPISCLYKTSDKEMSSLVAILQHYFQKEEFKPTEIKNMVALVQLLIKLNLEETVISLDEFFGTCIIPNLHFTCSVKASLMLECLNSALNILVDSDFSLNELCMTNLVRKLDSLLNFYLNSERGKFKGLVAVALEVLGKMETHHKIMSVESKTLILEEVSKFNPAVSLYAKIFLPEYFVTSKCPMSLLWISCCISNTTAPIEKRLKEHSISYTDLLNILIQLLPHFSNSEWLHSVHLMDVCVKHTKASSEKMDVLFEMCEEFRTVYIVLRCFIDSFHFILQDFQGDINFLCSCFNNVVMNAVKEKKDLDPMFLLNIFLDLCHLASIIPSDNSAFHSVLIDLQKLVISACADKDKENFEKILVQALNILPDADKENSLFKKMSK